MSLGEFLAKRRLIVVTGKGGVGKSAVSAALARILAARGRRVLLLEVDPRENLHQLFDHAPSGGEIVPAYEGVWLQNVQPRLVLDALVREKLRIRMLSKRVLASPVYAHFVEGAPGLKELALLGHAYQELTRQPEPARADVVVLDAPATGHGIGLLAAPALTAGVIEEGPFGEMSRELAAFVDDPEATGLVAVTLAEEMPVQETRELIEALDRRLDRQPELVVANALYPPLEAAETLLDSTKPGTRLWAHRRVANERELARLREHWAGPLAHLPLVAENRGPDLLAHLEEALTDELERLRGEEALS